ncbi:hypothetical protein WK59_07330 [Burkholderia ubonensis]|nr:hypothetical protein WK59_07330 [Burkholderia ubonensis]
MGRSSGSDDASRAGIGHASASNRRQRAPYMNIQVFMMDDCATQGYGLFIPKLTKPCWTCVRYVVDNFASPRSPCSRIFLPPQRLLCKRLRADVMQ